MANTATAQTPLDIGIFNAPQIIPILFNMDTLASDLTVKAAIAGKILAIVGASFNCLTGDYTLQMKSGASIVRKAPSFATKNGWNQSVSRQILMCTQPGDALVFNLTGTGATIVNGMVEVVALDPGFKFENA